MPVIFEGSRLRIERAHAHGKALAQAWNEIPAEDLDTVSAKVNTNGKGSIRLTRPKPSPPIPPSTLPPVCERRSVILLWWADSTYLPVQGVQRTSREHYSCLYRRSADSASFNAARNARSVFAARNAAPHTMPRYNPESCRRGTRPSCCVLARQLSPGSSGLRRASAGCVWHPC